MKRLVVIGGGFAGALIAKRLQRTFAVTLIDTKDYFEYTPGVLRCLVEPQHIRKIQVPHKHYLKRAKFVSGEAEGLSAHSVKVNGADIFFDYAAICAGSSYALPFKQANLVMSMRGKLLRENFARVRDAKRILIIGGGLVGVELAAEIAWKYRGKDITIVHAAGRLIERNRPRASRLAERFLTKRGVRLFYDELVQSSENRQYPTNKGRVFEPDLAFLCTGISPNAAWMRAGLPGAVNERGLVKVNRFLQIEGFPHLFAAGDVNSVAEEKTAQHAEHQAAVIAHNLVALTKKRPLRVYRSRPRPLDLSLGKYDGIIMWGPLNISGLIPAFGKFAVERWTMWHYR